MRKNNQYTKQKADFDKIKDQLTIGGKYTFWGIDNEGKPFLMRFELKQVEAEFHGTESSILFRFRPFRASTVIGFRRLSYETFLIFEGWQTLPLEFEDALKRKPFIHYERGLI
jgi:hypothetical protein